MLVVISVVDMAVPYPTDTLPQSIPLLYHLVNSLSTLQL